MNDNIDIILLNKRAWDHVAERYEREYHAAINPLFYYFCNNLPRNAFILDLGCGNGLPYAKLFIEKGFKVLGIDISSQMLKLAKENVPQAEYKELSMIDINYKNKFDGVFSSFSMLLLNPTLFKEVGGMIINSLKKAGLFYLSLNEPWDENADVDGEVFVEIMGETMYSRAYTKEEVLKTFIPLNMKLLQFSREIQKSKVFGTEHTTFYIFKKR